jgi:hypothetical protein
MNLFTGLNILLRNLLASTGKYNISFIFIKTGKI